MHVLLMLMLMQMQFVRGDNPRWIIALMRFGVRLLTQMSLTSSKRGPASSKQKPEGGVLRRVSATGGRMARKLNQEAFLSFLSSDFAGFGLVILGGGGHCGAGTLRRRQMS